MKTAMAALLASLMSGMAAAGAPVTTEQLLVSYSEDPEEPPTSDAPPRHPNIARGLDPNRTVVGDLDSVNLFNGNLTLSILVGQRYSLSSRLSYQLALHYNSSVWDFEQFEDTSLGITVTQALPNRRSNAGLGWSLSLGRLYDPGHVTNETGLWVYEGPDGADHSFFGKLHEEDTAVANVFYTRDGSYLRMRVSGARRLVEFPDGTVHEFEASPEGPWRLRVIRDGFVVNGVYVNRLDVSYVPNDAGSVDWILSDTQSRDHTISFKRVVSDGAYIDVVDSVTLAAEGTQTATYSFTYDETASTVRPCTDDDERPGGTSQMVTVPVLTTLTVPEVPAYRFSYLLAERTFCPENRRSIDNRSGVIAQAALPTGGSISWGWTEYRFPSFGTAETEIFIQSTWGVGSRSVSDPARGTTAGWSYTPSLDQDPQDVGSSPPNVLINTVVDPAGDRTQHFFNVRRVDFADGDYGLPFHPLLTDGTMPTRYLSRREYEGDGTTAELRRAHYVRYEHDTGPTTTADSRNARVVSNMTRYVGDFPLASQPAIAASTSSGFDGLGNYRTVTTAGNFNSANESESVIDFNPARKDYPGSGDRTFIMLPSTDPWILGTYSSVMRTEGSSQAVRKYCFAAATGVLERVRTLGGSTAHGTDLLEVYKRDDSGNVIRRDLYGGDGATLETDDPLCTMSLPPLPSSRTVHTWSGGVMTSTQYHAPSEGDPSEKTAMPFKIFDITVDADTGLPITTRDVSGLSTSFTYDSAGRVKTMDPPGSELEISYSYTDAATTGDFAPSDVITTRGSGTSLVRSISQFDGLGRPWREKMLMPDNTWTLRETQLNESGWVTGVSEPDKLVIPMDGTELDFDPSHFTAFSDFDIFGRPRLTTLPDGKTTEVEYSGARVVTTKRAIATTNAGGETWVSTQEEYDRQGRLWKVTENSGSTTDQVVTTYKYDVADRLTSVVTAGHGFTQPARTFTYDGRGLLTTESHPESGTTSYTYNARGQVTRRETPLRALVYAYDDAGRVLTVTEENVGTVKEFAYDRPNAGTDYSLGKTDYASRHNRQPFLGPDNDVVVTETYRYGGIGGRLSSKETTLSTGETFTDSYEYNTLGLLKKIELPQCAACPDQLSLDGRSIGYSYTNGLLSSVPRYASSITYHPNGMLQSIRHLNSDGSAGPLYQQTLDASGMARTGSISVTDTCSNLSVTQQPVGDSISTGESATLSAAIAGATSYQWYSTANGVDTFLANQTTASIQVTPSITTSYFVRGSNGVCSIDSATAVVTVVACPSAAPSITAPASMAASSTATANVAAGVTVTGYDWSISNGTIISGQGTSGVTFRAACSGPAGLTVTVTTNCTAQSATASVTVTPGSSTLSAQPLAIGQGSSSTLTGTLTGIGPWDVTWSDGSGAQQDVPSPITRTVSPSQTTSYTMTAVNPYGCSTTSSSVTVTVKPPTPSNVLATAQTATSVLVQWSFSGTADSFEIQRYDRATGSPNSYQLVGTRTSTARSFTDTSAPAATACLYRIRAIRGGTASDVSTADLATTVVFGADVLPGDGIDDDHVAKLRNAVNAVRRLAAYSDSSFTDASLAGAIVRVPHVQELRTALDVARSALSLPAIPWIDRPLTTSHFVRAIHINQLREGVE